ncbi:hypothetical protein G9A89_007483 [Geosiphon pyriformis]|nr:hypothetical protein G9A89_007483 [Geosiphon pyriformis]
MGNYSYLPQQSEEHFKAHNKNNLDFIELNLLLSSETYTAYTIYYFDQAYFKDNFERRNNTENSFETEEKSYQTAPIFDIFSSESEHFTQTAYKLLWDKETTLHYYYLEAIHKIQLNDWMTLKELLQPTNTMMNSSAIWFSQETDANPHQRIIRWMPANAGENNISFTTQFENKFRTPILISKWCMKLEKKTQGPGEIVTEYAKAIRKLIKIHLGSILPVFASAPIMASASQMTAVSFAAQTQDPNKQLIDRLTANLAQLLEPLAQAVRNNQQPQRPSYKPHSKIVVLLLINNNASNQRPNHANINFFGKDPLIEATGKSANQPEKNLFFTFNLTDDDHNMDELAINTSESTRKKKKAKVDFVLDPNKASTSTADNNEPPKTKVFKNPPKLEPPEIVQKSGPYSVVKDLMETPAHITFGQLITQPQFRKDLHKFLIPKKKTPKTNKCPRQAGLADNSNVTPLICKAQVAGYFIDLILDSRSSVSVIAKHFLEAIGRKIDEPSTQPMTNVHGNKKKNLGITKAIPVHINRISIETDMEVSKAKEYTIIVGNEWLKKAKALLDYELCELTIRCGEKPITTPPATKQNQEDEQSKESDNEESDEEDKQEEQEETAELVYTTFTSNGKPLNNIKANRERIIVNSKLICWPYYDILRRTFDQKPGKKAKYSYWWHGPCVWCWCNKPFLIPRDKLKEVQKSFENEPPKIQSLVVKQKEPSPEERKIDIENLLARNSPVISKEGDTPG